MVKIAASAVLIAAVAAVSSAIPLCFNPTPIKGANFDAVAYQGRWYEIASSPVIYQSFEKQCECVTANYKLLNSTTVEVFNTCREGGVGAEQNDILGYATIPDPSKAALKVSFPSNSPLANFFIDLLGPNYYIVKIDPEYQWVIVGFPCDVGAWILARTPTIADSLYSELYNYILTHLPLATIGFRKTVQNTCSYSPLVL